MLVFRRLSFLECISLANSRLFIRWLVNTYLPITCFIYLFIIMLVSVESKENWNYQFKTSRFQKYKNWCSSRHLYDDLHRKAGGENFTISQKKGFDLIVPQCSSAEMYVLVTRIPPPYHESRWSKSTHTYSSCKLYRRFKDYEKAFNSIFIETRQCFGYYRQNHWKYLLGTMLTVFLRIPSSSCREWHHRSIMHMYACVG